MKQKTAYQVKKEIKTSIELNKKVTERERKKRRNLKEEEKIKSDGKKEKCLI